MTVRGRADLVALDGVQVLEGRLTIVGTDLTDVAELGMLERVGGLKIASNPSFESLHGLERLSEVIGDLEISDAPRLSNIDALGALSSVGGVLRLAPAAPDPVIAPAPVGLGNAALPSLRTVGGLSVRDAPALLRLDVPALVRVAGELSVVGAPRLRELEALRLTQVGDVLRIGRATAPRAGEGDGQNLVLERIAFPSLASVDGLVVEACPNLRTLDAPALFDVTHDLSLELDSRDLRIRLPGVRVVGRDATLALGQHVVDVTLPLSRVGRNLVVGEGTSWALAELTRVDGVVRAVGLRNTDLYLFALEKAGSLALHDPGVGAVKLPALREIGTLSLSKSGAFSLELPALTRLDSLTVRDEARLARVELGAVAQGAAAIAISGCPALKLLDLRSIPESASFELSCWGSWIETVRLDALTRVRGNVTILDGLPGLGTLDALTHIDGALKLWLQRGDADAVAAFLARVRVAGDVDAKPR